MNPFRKRAKSSASEYKKNGKHPAARKLGAGGSLWHLPGSPQIISTPEVAFSLPSENAFRTSLLMPKMADRFSLLRVNEPGQKPWEAAETKHASSGRDLSILEEGDEEADELPIHPWGKNANGRDSPAPRDGMSKEEFVKVRAQEGNSLFSGKQRTFKIKAEDGNETDRQYSSSSMSSKSPHSPAFEYRPTSSHSSAASSILFSTPKPPAINAKAANILGFDFGLVNKESKDQLPPPSPQSPTSTVYEINDSPTVPNFLITDDVSTTVDFVRNHLRRPSTSHSKISHQHKRSNSWSMPERETLFQSNDDRDSLFWGDGAGVFSYYERPVSHQGLDEEERVIMGEEWVQGREVGEQVSKAGQRPPTAGSLRPSVAKVVRSQPNLRESIFDDLPPRPAPANASTTITIHQPPKVMPPTDYEHRQRNSDDFQFGSNTQPPVAPLNTGFQSGTLVALGTGYESDKIIKEASTGNPRQKLKKQSIYGRPRSSTETSSRSRSSSNNSSQGSRRPMPPITTDPLFVTPELRSPPLFPNSPPPGVSTGTNTFAPPQMPRVPDQSMTPPTLRTERKTPNNVIKALKDRNISEPTFISMTATVPTVPIIRMGDERLERLRSDRRKTTRTPSKSTSRKTRRSMFSDEEDDVEPPSSRKMSPPTMTPRSPPRRQTTAGSVIFDELLKEGIPSRDGNKLVAGPEYSLDLPSPHNMNDHPYQQMGQHVGQQKPRHRRKVSRQEVDPAATLSSPAIMNQWNDERRVMNTARSQSRMDPSTDRRMDPAMFLPKRRMEGAVDPAW